MDTKQKVEWLLKYYSGNESHTFMYEERQEKENKFNIDLGIEEHILKSFKGTVLVLLTGDAGDGKTKVIRNLKKMKPNLRYEEDFSALDRDDQEELLKDIYKAINTKESSEKFVLAGNSGVFTKSAIETNYELFKIIEERKKCIVINFNYRNFGKEPEKGDIKQTQLFNIVQDFLGECTTCTCECVFKQENDRFCPFEYNLTCLKSAEGVEGLRTLLHALFLMGIHVTFRELLSLLSYAVTAGKRCCEMEADSFSSVNYLFFNNIFGGGNGDRILLELARLDVAFKDSDRLDYKIYKNSKSFEELLENSVLHSYLLLESGNTSEAVKNQLYRNCFIKRYLFFTNPKKLQDKDEDSLALLPQKYFSEYNKLLNEIKKYRLLTNRDRNELVQGVELGLNRLAAPKSTNGSFEVYDSPPMVSRNFKIKYKINMSELELVFTLVNSEDTVLELAKGLNYDENSFHIKAYKDDDPDDAIAFLKVDFELFEQICMARDGVIYPARKVNTRDARLEAFREDIVSHMVIKDNLEICWTGIDRSFAENFKMIIFNNRRTDSKGISVEKI